MRLTYCWTERDWNEAVRLASSQRRRPGLPGLTYAMVGIPLLAAAGELSAQLRSNRDTTLVGSTVPLLLCFLAVTVALLLLRRRSRHARSAPLTSMPPGQWDAVLKESGWYLTERPDVGPGGALDRSSISNPATTSGRATGPVAGNKIAEAAQQPLHPAPLRPWTDLLEVRRGHRVLVLMRQDGFEAIPMTTLSPEQGGHLNRLVTRKLRSRSEIRHE